MISNLGCGLYQFELGEFRSHPLCLKDFPLKLLDSFINRLEKGYGKAIFKGESESFELILNLNSILLFKNKGEGKENERVFQYNEKLIVELGYDLLKEAKEKWGGCFIDFLSNKEQAYYKKEVNKKINKLEELLMRTG